MRLKLLIKKLKQIKLIYQYDLDREAAKISALSSKDFDKYEYLTGKDLGYKQVKRAKFKYSALGEAFNKVFKKVIKSVRVNKQ